MPFVPLGSRKRIEVILDNDKHRLSSEMKAKDNATVKLHHQHMPGNTGYKYANHPITMNPNLRGPEAPFARANKPWTAPEDDPSGMAAMRDMEQAPVGALRDGSHEPMGETMRKSRSTPAMVRTLKANPVLEGGKSLGEQAKEKANPLSIELSRWQRLAEVTKRDVALMPGLSSKAELYREIPKPKKVFVNSEGLLNFPKYMLFENSHLKQTDFQRFVDAEDKARKEAEERHAAVEEAMAKGEVQDTPASTSRETPASEEMVPFATASWGAPRLRGDHANLKHQWAGNPLPTGKGSRSSNPFRN